MRITLAHEIGLAIHRHSRNVVRHEVAGDERQAKTYAPHLLITPPSIGSLVTSSARGYGTSRATFWRCSGGSRRYPLGNTTIPGDLMKHRQYIVPTGVLAAVLALSACSASEETPVVTPAPSVSSSAEVEPDEETTEPTEPPTTEAATPDAPTSGTREAPLALGETRKVSEESMWNVGVTASNLDAAGAIQAADEYAPRPAEGERFILATLQVIADSASATAQGLDISEGADPRASLFVSYVAADGTSYEPGSGSYCYTANDFNSVASTVYADGATVSGDFCIAVPSDKVDGGLWRIANGANDAVWAASS